MSIYDFIRFDIPVVCPNCSQKAVVKVGEEPHIGAEAKVVCPACGYHKHHAQLKDSTSVGKSVKVSSSYTLGAALDPYFKLPLWLQTHFEGHILWAYNTGHLELLKEHVGAKLRERNSHDNSNQSIGSRLPRWMTSQKNREAILKKIAELEQK